MLHISGNCLAVIHNMLLIFLPPFAPASRSIDKHIDVNTLHGTSKGTGEIKWLESVSEMHSSF